MTKTVNIKLRIDEDLNEALKALASAGDRSVAAEMRRALRVHVERAQAARDAVGAA